MVLRLALNYGSRFEILDAIARLAQRVGRGELELADLRQLTEAQFEQNLYDPDMIDPDLLIRTAGEMRVSNFLLWQISYSELWVTEDKWPDFGVAHLEEAIGSYQGRERRFGRVPGEQPSSSGGESSPCKLVGEDASS